MLFIVSIAGFFWFSVLHVSFNHVFKWGCSSICRTEKAVEKKRYQDWELGSTKYLVIPEKIGEETSRSHCQFLEWGLAELCFYFHIHWYSFGLALACITGNILQKPSGSFRQSDHTILSLSLSLGLWHSTGILQKFSRGTFREILLEQVVLMPQSGTKLWGKILLMFSQHRLLFALWTQHTVCVKFAMLFL